MLLWHGLYCDQAGRNIADIYRVICIRVETFQNSETDTFASILAMFNYVPYNNGYRAKTV